MTDDREALHQYWNSFYESRSSDAVPEEPSAFARWAKSEILPSTSIVEFGFGNARDSLWFARQGHNVSGFDFADSAVARARLQAREAGLEATFDKLDLYSQEAAKDVVERLGRIESKFAIYGRFLIHSVKDAGRWNLFDIAAAALKNESKLFLEFRTGRDSDEQHLFGNDHFRQYLDTNLVVDEIASRGGRVEHREEGHGFAVYKSEDPHVARIVASWT